MLKFLTYDDDGGQATDWPLRNCYMIGSDGSPARGEVRFEEGLIVCEPRDPGTAALVLQHNLGDLGEMTVQTCLLPEREEPYLLSLELARHRLMLLFTKLEDWGMFDLSNDHPVTKRTQTARKLFIEALCLQGEDPAKADQLAQQCLFTALDGSEELALAHSQILLNRRKQSGAIPRSPLGCGISLSQQDDRLRAAMAANFDFIQVPCPWKVLAPEEGDYHWQAMDQWVNWGGKNKLPVVAGPVLSFEASDVPDWLYIWEHDFDTVRDLIYEHVERVVKRYRNSVTVWNIASGLHVNQHFSFNFEQIMDLTRMSAMLVKKVQPAAKVMLEIRQPFGEYYGANPRSIPPLTYADLIVQSGIGFDVLGVRLPMGQAVAGQYTRDLLQISGMLDQFQPLGKPLSVTFAAPSEPVTSMMIADPAVDEPVDDNSGSWRRPWSGVVQSHWLEAVFQIAVSKPFVEAVVWGDLADHPRIELPLSGLISEEGQPKPAFKRLISFRRNLFGDAEEQGDQENQNAQTPLNPPVAQAPLEADPDRPLPLSDDE